MSNVYAQRTLNIAFSDGQKVSTSSVPVKNVHQRAVDEKFETSHQEFVAGKIKIAAGATEVISMGTVGSASHLEAESSSAFELRFGATPDLLLMSPLSVPTGGTVRSAMFSGNCSFTSLSIRNPGTSEIEVTYFILGD